MISSPSFLPDVEEMRARIGVAVNPLDRAQRTREAFPPSGPAVTPQVMQARAMPAPRVGEIGGGIDVRSYVGSMWSQPGSYTAARGPGSDLATMAAGRVAPNGGQPAAMRDAQGRPMSQDATTGAPQSSPSTLAPTGNPAARDAVLRSQFPNASRGGIGALGNMAWNRPGEFNAAMAGTRLDPTMADQRSRGAEADIAGANARTAATVQGTGIQADEAARRARGDAAMDSFMRSTYGADLQGVPAEVASHIASLAEQRARTTATANRRPEPMTVGGVAGVWDGSNFRPNAQPKPINDRASRIDRLNQAMSAAKAAGNEQLAGIYANALKTESEGQPNQADQIVQGIGRLVGGATGTESTPKPGAAPAAKPAATSPKPDANEQARTWLKANPNDPRAPAIRKKLGL
jgi:hypothetical protein